jgi:hypothetical protein
LLFNGKPSDRESTGFTVIEEGVELSFRPKDRELELFSTQEGFEAFYARINQNRIPKPQAPHIDFTRSIVVFITLGEKTSAGFSIDVRSVYMRTNTLVVKALPIAPPQESLQAQMITHPYALILIPETGFTRVEWVNDIGEVLESENL